MVKTASAFFIAAILLALAVFYDRYYHDNFEGSELVRQIEKNLELHALLIKKEVDAFESDSTSIQFKYNLILVDSSSITRWSSHDFFPEPQPNHQPFRWAFVQNQRGSFLLYKKPVQKGGIIFACLPLHTKFPVSNRFLLPELNAQVFPISGIEVVAAEGEKFQIKLDETLLFGVRFEKNIESVPTNRVSLLLFLAGVAALLVALVRLSSKLKTPSFRHALLISVVLVALRILSLATDVPRQWINSSLFDPQIFASSSYNRSVGDLFVNTVVVLAVVLILVRQPVAGMLWRARAVSPRVQILIGTAVLMVIHFSVLFPFLFIETITHNSNVVLDITQSLPWNLVRIVAWISVFLGAVAAGFVVHVCIRISMPLLRNWRFLVIALVISVCIFVTFFMLSERNYWITIAVSGLLIVFSKVISLRVTRRNVFFSYSYVSIVVLIFSLQAALSLRKLTEDGRIDAQFKFARDFLSSRDVFGEYLLDQASKRISADPFVQARLSTPFLDKTALASKIKQIHLPNFFDQYEISIFLFDGGGNNIFSENEKITALTPLDFSTGRQETGYEGIYFMNPTSQFVRRYSALIPINKQRTEVGLVALELTLKKVIPNSVYPELLIDNRFSQFFKSRKFSYAFYRDGVMESSYGAFEYGGENFDASQLSNRSLFTVGIKSKGGLHVAEQDEFGKTSVVSSERYPILYAAANFSFFVIVSMFLTFMCLLIIRWESGRPLVMNYAARIRLFMFLILVIPLLIVALALVAISNRSLRQDFRDDLQSKSKMVAENVSRLIVNDNDSLRSESVTLTQQLAELSKFSSADATVYDPAGRYVASTQPQIFENNLLSPRINPVALRHFRQNQFATVILEEELGKLQYSNAFSALLDASSGKLVGILSLPFFDSLSNYEQTKINVLSVILTVFVLVFVLFTVLSIYAVDWLTHPLQYITNQLKRTTLTGENERMQWKSNDEIGQMVNEYNRMVDNLEVSKGALARSQREAAWKELAQQVAHEIKNPLTPMKLTLQHLKGLTEKGDINAERLYKSIASMLMQVDILNDVATSFSSFARMPTPELKEVDLLVLLRSAISLHEESGLIVDAKFESENILVWGDEALLQRIFSNLLLNAKQAVKAGEKSKVSISISIYNDHCILKFADNGTGIDPTVQDKIFIPHFSTKKSGSGLGLAIAKQGIELSGGKIWFESNLDVGTTFFVQLALADR